MSSICVFCASALPKNPLFKEHTLQLAQILAEKDYTLVYGGAHVGLMGILARRVMELGGKVVGIMPHSLTGREVASDDLTEKYLVSSMAERKRLMLERSQALVVLPGGLGTMDEFWESVCLSSLGEERKPIILINSGGFYNKLLAWTEEAYAEGLLALPFQRYVSVIASPSQLEEALANFQLPPIPSWVRLGDTK